MPRFPLPLDLVANDSTTSGRRCNGGRCSAVLPYYSLLSVFRYRVMGQTAGVGKDRKHCLRFLAWVKEGQAVTRPHHDHLLTKLLDIVAAISSETKDELKTR